MRVECSILTAIHLDPGYALLSVQNCLTCMEMFNILDIHRTSKLNDVQFMLLLKNITNCTKGETEEVFHLMDIDHSGEVEFEEFYLLFCIFLACKDTYEKEFIYRHCTTIFQLIDVDGSGQISAAEFSRMGVMFNFDKPAIKRIFYEFDITGDKQLDFSEFRLFTMACIDETRAQDCRAKVKAFKRYRERLLTSLEPTLRRFIRTDRIPRPREIEDLVSHVRHPYVPGKTDIFRHFKYHVVRDSFKESREEIRDYFKEKFAKLPCIYCVCGFILCCYCCAVDPAEDYEYLHDGKYCPCKCKCHCLSCWAKYIRSLWTCCYCVFSCCHCCQRKEDERQHIGRRQKLKWPDMEAKRAQEEADRRAEEEQKLREQALKKKKSSKFRRASRLSRISSFLGSKSSSKTQANVSI